MTKTVKMLIIILPLTAILFYTSAQFFIKDSPAAVRGRLDLSSWDFNQDGIVTLDGEWECYDGQLLTPEDFSENAALKPNLTGYTNLTISRLAKSEKESLEPKGIRTYRLLIKIKSSKEPFGLKIDNIRMSNKLYVNGIMEGYCGNPAERGHGYVPKNAAYNAYFDVPGDQMEILLQTANFDYPFRNNNTYAIILGNQRDIDFQRTGIAAAELSGAVVSLFFGVYYLYLCLTGGKDRGALYSSTQFFSLAVLLLFTGQKLIYGWFPDMPFELFCKIQLLSLIGVPASTVSYANFTEKWVISDLLKRITLTVFAVYAFILLVTNYETSSYLNGFIYAFICTVYLYILIKLCIAYHMVTPGTILKKEILLYLSCTGCLFLAFLNNFLYNLTWIPTRAIGMIGLCGFILLSQIFIAFRFAVNYENMVKLDKMKDEFIIKTSYELKAPLNSIFNISEHMIKEYFKGGFSMENCIENAELTKIIAQRLLNIVNTSLDVTLLRNDQLKPIISSVDMKVCVDLAMESARDFMPDKKIEIRSELTESFFVEADENRARQILWNLILNSAKSMEQGIIWIRGKREHGMVSISVEDNGCGIPEDKWEEIFQPYMTLKSQGIGLGLYVTRQLVHLMQGNIYVDWSELNRGTRFVLRLPGSAAKNEFDHENPGKKTSLTEKQKRTLSENSSQNHSRDTKQDAGNTVLVVDDEIFNLKTAAYILGEEGYHVLTAQTGEEALHIVRTQPVDLIILDVMLPRDSGISVCKKIRETFSLIELPVLIAVVGTENNDINLGLEAGANDFIRKPFQEAEVKARIKTLIELKKSLEKAMRSELAFLQAQIRPHFLYNAISTMISFCYTDSEKAAKLLSDFSKYLRLTFDVDHTHMLIPLSREIELIDAYAAIEQARFGDKIKLRYDIDPELMCMEIPPLCIQPLVENAIKHGLCKKKEGGIVFISARKKEAELQIAVRDNGAGMTKEKLDVLRNTEDGAEGVGFSNISKRMKKWKQAQIEIQSEPEEGTTVTITIQSNH